MKTSIRFKAETKYQESAEKKANANLPIMAVVGDRSVGAAVVAVPNKANFYWIRLLGDDNRLTQCFSPSLVLSANDVIYVAKARDRKLTWYEFVSFVQDGDGETSPPVCPKFAQVVYVSQNGCHFTTLLDAVNYIKGLPAGSRPAAGQEFMIEIQAGTYTETGDIDLTAGVAITHTNIRGQGEATIINMGDNCLTLNDDCSLESTIITGTGDNANWNLIYILGDNVTLREVRAILTNWNTVVEADTVSGLEMYHVVLECTVAAAYGFYFTRSCTALLWDCKADDASNFDPALYLSGTNNTVTTKFCEFRGDTYSVRVLANNIWRHICCNSDAANTTVAGTSTPLEITPINLDGWADALILDADGDTTISAPADDQIDFEINGADDFRMTANMFQVLSGSHIMMADDSTIGIAVGAERIIFDAAGDISVMGADFGVGTQTPATLVELEEVETLVGALADGYAAGLTLDPGYTGNFAVTRHNYIDVQDVSLAGGATVTDAAVMRFDAALGTHLATTNLDKTANAKPGTIKVNVAGTILHLQLYAT